MAELSLQARRIELVEDVEKLERQIARAEKNLRFMDRGLQQLETEIKATKGPTHALLRNKKKMRVTTRVDEQTRIDGLYSDLRQARRHIASLEAEIQRQTASMVADRVDTDIRERAGNLLKALSSVRSHGYHYPENVQVAEERLREVV